ncbi:MAG: hypothetical protein WD894_16275 [Pirellulales bacterium]
MLLITEGLQTGQKDLGEFWEDFYSQKQLPSGFTVLDPFLGGGTSLVEASKLGATCIGVDIDPVACFVTAMELLPVDPAVIRSSYQKIESTVAEKIQSLYRTRIGGKDVDVVYYFWVDRVTCPKCKAQHDGHPTYQLAYDTPTRTQTVICPHCNAITTTRLNAATCTCSGCKVRIQLGRAPVANGRYDCPSCHSVHSLHQLYRQGLAFPRLMALEYFTKSEERGFATVTNRDLELYAKACDLFSANKKRFPIPDARIPTKGRVDSRPLLYGYRRYREMFNDRQLYCLGLIGAEIRKLKDKAVRQLLGLAFSQALATNNMFCGYAFGYRRLTPLFGVHSYRKISRPVEGNVWGLAIGRGSFRNTVRAVVAGKEYIQAPYEFRYRGRRDPVRVYVKPQSPTVIADPPARPSTRVLNRSSIDLSVIDDESVDFLLTDPPYFDNISYSELSDFYHVWLKELLGRDYCGYRQTHTPMSGALFAGKRRGAEGKKAERVYRDNLATIFRECHRVAKPDSKLAFTFHHRTDKAWACLGYGLLLAGFQVETVFPIRSEGRSGFHSYEGSIKWDSVFVCDRGARGKLKRPTSRVLTHIATSASARAAAWRTKIRKRKLFFGPPDEASLARSLVIREFSIRGLHPTSLGICMTKLDH